MDTIDTAPSVRVLPTEFGAPALNITLEEGLIGCEMWQHFTLEAPADTAPLMLLRSLDEPDISFIVCDPRAIESDYSLALSDTEMDILGGPSADELAMFVIMNVKMIENRTQVTVNLLGPVVVNLANGAARQVINPDHLAHHPVGDLSHVSADAKA